MSNYFGLGKETNIEMSAEQFKEFNEVLDRPAVANPALHRLLTEPSAIELAQSPETKEPKI